MLHLLLAFSFTAAATEPRTPARAPAEDASASDAVQCYDELTLEQFIADVTQRAGAEAPDKKKLTAMFNQADTDGDGSLSSKERKAGDGGGWTCSSTQGYWFTCVCRCP